MFFVQQGPVRQTDRAAPLTRLDLTCTIELEQGDNRPMFAIDAQDPTPLYAQLERSIRVAVATERLRGGDRLPTVRQLAVDLRVNANTVAKVYAELERAGVLESRRGVGTFVRAAPAEAAAPLGARRRALGDLVRRFLADAATLGFTAHDAIEHLHLQSERNERGDSDA
jgi:GntR family transcriptional regulator